jgi:hypothetical protein
MQVAPSGCSEVIDILPSAVAAVSVFLKPLTTPFIRQVQDWHSRFVSQRSKVWITRHFFRFQAEKSQNRGEIVEAFVSIGESFN